MSRIRTLKPEIMEDEKLAPLDDSTRLLAKGLILFADDHGCGKAHAGLLSVRVWPYGDPRESLMKTERGLRELAGIGLILLYTVKGQAYYSLPNWRKHQRVQHPGARRVPAPSDADPSGNGTDPNGPGGGRLESSASASDASLPAHDQASSGDSHETLAPDLRSGSPIKSGSPPLPHEESGSSQDRQDDPPEPTVAAPVGYRPGLMTLGDQIREGITKAYERRQMPPPIQTRFSTWPGWSQIARWVMDKAEMLGEPDRLVIAGHLVECFFDHPAAKAKGHPIAFLSENANEYWRPVRHAETG